MKEKNYITPEGYDRLKSEWEQLTRVEHPEVTKTVAWAASNGDRSENADYQYGKKRLREIDRRLRFLGKRLDCAVVVDPHQTKSEQIKFGATVVLLSEEGEEKTFQIVGVDEVDTGFGKISWKSPLGNALLGKEVGDIAVVRAPQGDIEWEIQMISYEKGDAHRD